MERNTDSWTSRAKGALDLLRLVNALRSEPGGRKIKKEENKRSFKLQLTPGGREFQAVINSTRLYIMVDSLPTKLVDVIIDKLDPSDDKSTLLECALVGRAWACASQRSIFQTIHLKVPNPIHDNVLANYLDMADSEGWSYIYRFVKNTDRLIKLLNKNPILGSYVLYLELEDLDGIEKAFSDNDMDWVYTAVAEVVNRLSNVRKISMVCADWDGLSSMLRTAILSTPSVTSLAFESFTISTAADFASLLNHSVHLKALEAVDVEFRKESNAYINYTGLPLKPDTLVLGGSEAAFLPWFQQQSRPFGFENLQSLKIRLEPPGGYEMADFLLQQAGHSLTKLELDLCCDMRLRSDRSLRVKKQLDMRLGLYARLAADVADRRMGLDMKLKQDMDWLHTETTFENLLGYVPHLKSIWLVEVPQKGSYTPVPCILSLFKPLLDSDLDRYPLQHIGFGLRIDYSVTMEWDSWSAFDVLLENPKFDSLRTVDIVMKMGSLRDKKGREAAKVAMENLSGSLPFLKRSGKLKIRLHTPKIRKIKLEEWHRDISNHYLGA